MRLALSLLIHSSANHLLCHLLKASYISSLRPYISSSRPHTLVLLIHSRAHHLLCHLLEASCTNIRGLTQVASLYIRPKAV
jgi:hypothetical protein